MADVIGCGKISMPEILKYIEGSADDKSRIDRHLSECGVCLAEVVELNRIAAVMDNGDFFPVKKPNYIILRLKKGIINQFNSATVDVAEESLAETRDLSGFNKRNGKILVFKFDSIPALVKVIPAGENTFRIYIESERLKGNSVELRKNEDILPIYSKKSDLNEVLIKDVTIGKYEILFDHEKINLEIINDD